MSTNKTPVNAEPDFHIHCLPQIDDGADSPETALRMLDLLCAQGITEAVATPHFYPGRETTEEFIKRREQSVAELQAKARLRAGNRPHLTYGAEVQIFRDLSDIDLPQLSIGRTDHVLLELPYAPYDPWMAEAMWNAMSIHKLTPVIAHLDRYMMRYRQEDLNEVLSLPNVVVQINVDAFYDKKKIKRIREIADKGYPIVLGSDAHNLEARTPDFSPAAKYLNDKKGADLREHIQNSNFLGCP